MGNKNSSDSFNYRTGNETGSDRLLAITTVAPTKEAIYPLDPGDILDEDNNPTAQRFSQMISNSSRARYSGIRERMLAVRDSTLPGASASKQTQEGFPAVDQDSEWFIQDNKASSQASTINNSSILLPTSST